MSVVLWLALAWLVVASVAAVVIGTAIRLAEEQDAVRRGRDVEAFPVDVPTPHVADSRRHVAGRR